MTEGHSPVGTLLHRAVLHACTGQGWETYILSGHGEEWGSYGNVEEEADDKNNGCSVVVG